jgi:hypothetical protein
MFNRVDHLIILYSCYFIVPEWKSKHNTRASPLCLSFRLVGTERAGSTCTCFDLQFSKYRHVSNASPPVATSRIHGSVFDERLGFISWPWPAAPWPRQVCVPEPLADWPLHFLPPSDGLERSVPPQIFHPRHPRTEFGDWCLLYTLNARCQAVDDEPTMLVWEQEKPTESLSCFFLVLV